jgi:hypothetical protein
MGASVPEHHSFNIFRVFFLICGVAERVTSRTMRLFPRLMKMKKNAA